MSAFALMVLFMSAGALVPLAAFVRVGRRPSPTLGAYVSAATLGGGVVGVTFYLFWLGLFGSTIEAALGLLPSLVLFTVAGFGIGTVGVLARFWSARDPRI